MDADTTTVSVLSVVLANNSVSEDDVYNFTKSLFDGAQNNADAHAKYKELDLETATSITSVPITQVLQILQGAERRGSYRLIA